MKALWNPSTQAIENSQLTSFIKQAELKSNKKFDNYEELHQWSVENIEDFWQLFWQTSEMIYEGESTPALVERTPFYKSSWFPNVKINFAENLLRYRDNKLAIIWRGENGERRELSYLELFEKVAGLTAWFKEHDLSVNDRVVALMPNIPETIICMLAVTSLGGVFSSCSPDFGDKGVIDRFRQIQPKFFICCDYYYYRGKKITLSKKNNSIRQNLPNVKHTLQVSFNGSYAETGLNDTVDLFSIKTGNHINFVRQNFSHPVYIMFSSGTTGLPKCMVQGSGVLLNQIKEHLLHGDLKREDKIFYFTTCGWMMWNWLTSALAIGSTLCLYDGNPFYPKLESLWQIAEEEKFSVFGTSAKYLQFLSDNNINIKNKFSLEALKVILSTGSPLSEESFHYVYQKVKSNVRLSSIAGGTDLNGCFALGNPLKGVYAGELQCKGLGMHVAAFDEKAQSVIEQEGELVCQRPFPSMPLYFYNDKDYSRYHNSYFAKYDNVWRHGDFIKITQQGGIIFLGRSDATLNPAGVRIGSAEIYRHVEKVREVEDSLAIGQKFENDERIILFVKMKQENQLSQKLIEKIKTTILKGASPRHVPSKIIEVKDIPYTRNMKKVEIAVKRIINGAKTDNAEALVNPQSLKEYENMVID